MTNGEFLIQKIFKTFFPDLEYTIIPEFTDKYLYNVCIRNIIDVKFSTIVYTPQYISDCNKMYSDEDFIGIFKGFAPNLNGKVLVYQKSKYKTKMESIIVTPTMTLNDSYGLVARITDPYFNKMNYLKENHVNSLTIENKITKFV
jgi:hypothetical protein